MSQVTSLTSEQEALKAFRARLTQVLATKTKEELNQPDKIVSRFNEPGIYEVYASGAETKETKDKSKTYRVVGIKAADGRADNIPLYTRSKTGEPSILKTQLLLKGFGIDIKQAALTEFFDVVEYYLDHLLVGNVVVKLSYYGLVPDYVEKGVYCIRDYGKTAKPYPDNKLIDPLNNDVIAFQSHEEAETFLKLKGWTKGGKNWEFIRPSPDFKMGDLQKGVVEMLESLTGTPSTATTLPSEAKPARPAWLAGKV